MTRLLASTLSSDSGRSRAEDPRVKALLAEMTQEEKIGQLAQLSGGEGWIPEHLAAEIRAGRVGSVINEVDSETVAELQRLARQESRLGIPLLIGRDVIHGFNTIFPLPIGLASSWCETLCEQVSQAAAREASERGINWTFAPMIDICRDPRWGRIAESLGEDPYLCSRLGAAMVRGYQGDDPSEAERIAACAKHFVGYGAAESGRDYNTTNIPEVELRNVYMPPFKRAVEVGVATVMSGFNDLNGVPATGNAWLMDEVLKSEWQFSGFVVSDWESVSQLSIHGLTDGDRQAGYEAFTAGVDMEMVSSCFRDHVSDLIADDLVSSARLDDAVARILSIKFELGLFDDPSDETVRHKGVDVEAHMALAKEAATKSCVLLKNDHKRLPLNANAIDKIALIGPLSDDDYEQLGTWIFDGDVSRSVTCRQALERYCTDKCQVRWAKGVENTRVASNKGIEEAASLAAESDMAILVVGEEAILSGEAHSRTQLDLPGAQQALLEAVAATGTPVVLVIMAGRPLTLEDVLPHADAVLFAWHPGSMAGPAIVDLLFGGVSPSGRLPVTFPRRVGQIPIYHAQKHTGKPANDENCIHMKDLPPRMPQTSLGMAATHLDCHFTPQFPFGFGLHYSSVSYQDLSATFNPETRQFYVSCVVNNLGQWTVDEVAQLYLRDPVASVTRPVRELKGFQKVTLSPGERCSIEFVLGEEEMGFYGRDGQWRVEPGRFDLWVGADADADLHTSVILPAATDNQRS